MGLRTLASLAIATTVLGISGCEEAGSRRYADEGRQAQRYESQQMKEKQNQAVPEPSTIGYLLTGIGAVGAYGLSKRKR